MEQYDKRTVRESMKRFWPTYSDNDFIEVSEWENGDGIDIDINGEKHFELSYAELDAINYMSQTLMYPELEELEKKSSYKTYKDLIN